MSSQWVQHVSGVGAKWELTDYELADGHESDLDYEVYMLSKRADYFYLPKSEYRLCEPPERWVDVTEMCEVSCNAFLNCRTTQCGLEEVASIDRIGRGYRLRKLELWVTDPAGSIAPITKRIAFIVEKKETL